MKDIFSREKPFFARSRGWSASEETLLPFEEATVFSKNAPRAILPSLGSAHRIQDVPQPNEDVHDSKQDRVHIGLRSYIHYLGQHLPREFAWQLKTLPPFLMAGTRFAIAGILLFGFLKLRGATWPSAVQWRDQTIVGVFLLLGGNAVVSWAELRTPSGITALMLGVSPIIVVIFDWVRPGGKRPTLGLVIGVSVGVAGVAMLVGPGALPAGSRPPTIDIIALLLASVSWWIGSFYSKHAKVRTPLMIASAMQMLTGSACMLLTGWDIRGGKNLPLGLGHSHFLGGIRLPGRRRVNHSIPRVRLATRTQHPGESFHLCLREPRRGRDPRVGTSR